MSIGYLSSSPGLVRTASPVPGFRSAGDQSELAESVMDNFTTITTLSGIENTCGGDNIVCLAKSKTCWNRSLAVLERIPAKL